MSDAPPDDDQPQTRLLTERLELRAPVLAADAAAQEALADLLRDYYRRNRAYFAPWDPPRPSDFLSVERQRARLEQATRAWSEGQALVWWLHLRDDPAAGVVGHMNFSTIVRGVWQCANLGYSLDATLQGRGLMHEALQAGLAEVFSPRVALHRVQAAYRPENRRSGAVLDRLGFEREGYARDYLFIDGAWRDHVLTACRNPHWQGGLTA